MSHNLGFLDDESLTDNLNDKDASRLLNWLEFVAINHEEDLPQALDFVKNLNRYYKDEDKRNPSWIFYELFKMLSSIANQQDPLFITLAKYTLNKGEKDAQK